MKKLNTTYLDNLVSKILKETLEDRANDIVSKITESGNVCECGGTMYEGECNECGYKSGDMEEGIYDVKDLDNSEEFDYVQEDMVMGDSDDEELDSKNEDACKYHMDNFGPQDERTQKFCGSDMNEALKGRQRKLDRNKNNKIDAEDFEMLRKGETKEGKSFPDLTGDGKVTRKDVLVGRGVKFKKSNFEKNVKGLKNSSEKHGMEESSKEKFIQKAEKEIEKKGTKGDFAKHCGGEVTKSCIEKALKSGDPKLVKQANFAKNIKGYKGADHKKTVKESYRLTESEMVSLIEKIVKDQKIETVDKTKETKLKPIGGTPKGYSAYEKAHKGSGKENDDYIKDVTKKMKDYLKDGSNGDYDMNPKMFPKGNGEIEKMNKKAYEVSKDGEEFIDDYLRPGMQTLDYDEMHPNEEWMDNNIEGSSKTGNNSEWANAVETDENKKLNKTRKKGAFNKAKRAAYNKAPQPVISDKPGQESGNGLHLKTESNEKQQKLISEEFSRMKSLIGYNQRTQ